MLLRALDLAAGPLRGFWRSRSGATAIEYGLLASMIGIFLLSIGGLGNTIINSFYEPVAAALSGNAIPGGEAGEDG